MPDVLLGVVLDLLLTLHLLRNRLGPSEADLRTLRMSGVLMKHTPLERGI